MLRKGKLTGVAVVFVAVVYLFGSCAGGVKDNSLGGLVLPSGSVSSSPVVSVPPDSSSGSVAPVASGGVRELLNSLPVADASGVSYDRGEWHHWNDVTSCWSVREQVLFDEAVQDGLLTLLDKYKVRTDDVSKACYVAGGTWVDVYTGEVFTNPADLDVDHMVPLNYAAQHGGQVWDEARKEAYANSLEYGNHLVAVSASANRSKSDKGPSRWKPSNTEYYCTYATDWVNISVQWGLSVSQADKDALNFMLDSCPV